MPVRRRGSAVNGKTGLHVLVRNTQGANRGGLLQKSAFLEGKNKTSLK